MKKFHVRSRKGVAAASFGLGLGLLLGLAGCDAQDAQAPKSEAAKDEGRDPMADATQNAGQAPQGTAKGNGGPPTGPDYIKTSYDPKPQLGGLYTFDQLDIETHDGETLEALVTEPTADGRHPLIIMPGSWTMNRKEYEIPARQWASQGFVVISYTSRGFHGSGGEIDIAGPPTVRDVSSLIDWAGAHTDADTERVGVMGISYGGGVALLAAAEDSRIDAVVSMSGWTDLRFSNFPNNTGSGQSGEFLVSSAESTGRRGAVMKEIDKHLHDGKFDAALKIFDSRSPIQRIDKINDNEAAVMIAHAWNDGIFPPSQVLTFMEALEGDKRLLLQPGGHGSPDGLGVAGLPDNTWRLAMEWMRKHVVGEDLVMGPPVIVVSNDNKWVTTAASVQDWLADKRTFHLASPKGEGIVHHYGAMNDTGVFGWSFGIEGGTDTVAQSGQLLVSGALNGLIGLPQVMSTPTVDREHAAIWKSDPIMNSQNISGAPKLQINIESPDPSVTVVAYLYESLAGVASLVTYAPFTVRDLEPDVPKTVDFELEPTQWNITPGARLVLVLDTVDKRYQSETGKGQKITFSAINGSPATLEVPMRPAF